MEYTLSINTQFSGFRIFLLVIFFFLNILQIELSQKKKKTYLEMYNCRKSFYYEFIIKGCFEWNLSGPLQRIQTAPARSHHPDRMTRLPKRTKVRKK